MRDPMSLIPESTSQRHPSFLFDTHSLRIIAYDNLKSRMACAYRNCPICVTYLVHIILQFFKDSAHLLILRYSEVTHRISCMSDVRTPSAFVVAFCTNIEVTHRICTSDVRMPSAFFCCSFPHEYLYTS